MQSTSKSKPKLKRVDIYCDGSIFKNPGGMGGFAAVMISGKNYREMAGRAVNTTNNRMEMMAAIKALELVKGTGREVMVCSDSQYLIKGASQWLQGWMSRNWKTSEGKAVQNQDLWEQIHALSKVHKIRWVWVRGHNGHVHNERADVLARSAALGRFDSNMED